MSPDHYPLDIIRKHQPAWTTPGIDACAVANKLKAIRDLEHPKRAEALDADPRLGHLLWFIQSMSHQPGGLDKFACDFLLEFPERIKTKEMAEAHWPRSGRYTVEQCVLIWRGLNGRDYLRLDSEQLSPAYATSDKDDLIRSDISYRRSQLASQVTRILEIAGQAPTGDLPANLGYMLAGDPLVLRKLDPAKDKGAALLVMTLTPEFYWAECAKELMNDLPKWLTRLAQGKDFGFGFGNGHRDPKCFDGLVPALLEYMERFATKGRRRVAETAPSAQVSEKFNFALEMGANVLIAGDARLGKSVTMANDCRRQPGRARLVTIPPTVRQRDILRAHADALHVTYDERTSRDKLQSAVLHVLKHSGLVICYDEFHFAIPAGPPQRGSTWLLDWIRSHVVDRGLGVVFCVTRQGYNQRLSDFMKRTRWAIDQWAGRIDDILQIGEDKEESSAPVLPHGDLLKIARHKAPELTGDIVEAIADEALGAANPAHAIHAIILRARWAARKAGRPVPTIADAEAAIDDWKAQPTHDSFENPAGPPRIHAAPVSAPAAPPAPAAGTPAATPLPASGRPPAAPLPKRGTVPAPALEMPPERISTPEVMALAEG